MFNQAPLALPGSHLGVARLTKEEEQGLEEEVLEDRNAVLQWPAFDSLPTLWQFNL